MAAPQRVEHAVLPHRVNKRDPRYRAAPPPPREARIACSPLVILAKRRFEQDLFDPADFMLKRFKAEACSGPILDT